MTKYLKIAPDPDAHVCHCGDGNPDCDHWESCDACGMDYRKHEGHDCIDGVPVQDLRALAKELRDALASCETDRDRLRSELDAAHDGEDALRSEVARLRAQVAALPSVPQGVEVPEFPVCTGETIRKSPAITERDAMMFVHGFQACRDEVFPDHLVPTPPQDATGAQITFSQPETSPYLICDHCGGEMALTDGWVPTYSNPDNQGCNPSAEPYCPKCDAPHPLQPEERRVGPDEVVVPRSAAEYAFRAFDWIECPDSEHYEALRAFLDALRTSAQANNGEESK